MQRHNRQQSNDIHSLKLFHTQNLIAIYNVLDMCMLNYTPTQYFSRGIVVYFLLTIILTMYKVPIAKFLFFVPLQLITSQKMCS